MSSTESESIQKEIIQDYPRSQVNLPWNFRKIDENTSTTDTRQRDKHSALSINSHINTKTFIKEIQHDIDTLPHYLQRKNDDFQKLLRILRKKLTSKPIKNPLKHLRIIARCIYRMIIMQTYQSLWSCYHRSGQGNLIEMRTSSSITYSTTISIWPKAIQKLSKTKDSHVCQTLVQDQLDLLVYHYERLKQELNEHGSMLPGYTLAIQQRIQKYLQIKLHPWSCQIKHEIDLITHDYHIYAIKVAFLQMNPTKEQERWMKQLCGHRYEQEETEQEYQYVKEQIQLIDKHRSSIESSIQKHSKCTQSIPNDRVREAFFRECYPILEQSHQRLTEMYLQSAKQQRNVSADQYRVTYEQLKEYRKARQLTESMFQLIRTRSEHIVRRLECIYQFKRQSLHFNTSLISTEH